MASQSQSTTDRTRSIPPPAARVLFNEPTPLELLMRLKQAKELGQTIHVVIHELQNRYYPLNALAAQIQSPSEVLSAVARSYRATVRKLELLSDELDSGTFDGLSDEELTVHPSVLMPGRHQIVAPFRKELPTTRLWILGIVWNYIKSVVWSSRKRKRTEYDNEEEGEEHDAFRVSYVGDRKRMRRV
ncbi:hypothetical protein C8R42DRAFT_715260 [Lentinula raphanica]|nr:hypothetical protein C8R42DRAFT_715260 [Lentinula raphanica]